MVVMAPRLCRGAITFLRFVGVCRYPGSYGNIGIDLLKKVNLCLKQFLQVFVYLNANWKQEAYNYEENRVSFVWALV